MTGRYSTGPLSARCSSIRSVFRQPVCSLTGGRSLRAWSFTLLNPELGVGPEAHPWLTDLEGLGPGKRQQIVGFASNLGLHSPSRRTMSADLLHPALSQPVVEAVLATPTWRLTGGGHDRLLARRAFVDRLPPELVRRRSKAELGAYYGHVVAANIDRLRPPPAGRTLGETGLDRPSPGRGRALRRSPRLYRTDDAGPDRELDWKLGPLMRRLRTPAMGFGPGLNPVREVALTP